LDDSDKLAEEGESDVSMAFYRGNALAHFQGETSCKHVTVLFTQLPVNM
jgi:hypothetical protein